ncbi:uncharacterized protein LOC113226324 [Hyposmocoma kahamanoa]|uniref:uncharacterized protein LOC113226324 n=1 Tax=Hyposmocoma kahamanoa TaxID=1477025 RepID=UPI000E6D5B23|nr:uncharacterized protein LOC113226324 [Hyposmocoma kahamanoa]
MAKHEDYFLGNPKGQQFYRVLGLIMTFTATGDKSLWGYSTPNLFMRCNRYLVIKAAPITFVSQIVYLFLNHKELTFGTLGIMLSIMPVTFLVNTNVFSARFDVYTKTMKDFMTRIHIYNYQDQGEFVKDNLRIIERLTRWTFYYLLVFLMMDWAAWMSITCWNNYKNRELIRNKTMRLETVLYLVVPFDYEYDFNHWIMYHSFTAYLVWSGCIIIVIFNTLNFMFVYHLIGHINILKYKLKTSFTGECSDVEVRLKLVDVIKYHSFIISIFREMENAFGLNVTANYFYNLIADSLLMYQVMVGDKGSLVIYGLMFVVYVGCLILMSLVLEEIRRQSDGLAALVYYLPWENMSVSNQKMIIMLLGRVQPPLVFKAMGGLSAGVSPMISIIKSTFSYYVMLKSGM